MEGTSGFDREKFRKAFDAEAAGGETVSTPEMRAEMRAVGDETLRAMEAERSGAEVSSDLEFLQAEKPEMSYFDVQNGLESKRGAFEKSYVISLRAKTELKSAQEKVEHSEKALAWFEQAEGLVPAEVLENLKDAKAKEEEALRKAQISLKRAQTKIDNFDATVQGKLDEISSLKDAEDAYKKREAASILQAKGFKTLEEGIRSLQATVDATEAELREFEQKGKYSSDFEAVRAEMVADLEATKRKLGLLTQMVELRDANSSEVLSDEDGEAEGLDSEPEVLPVDEGVAEVEDPEALPADEDPDEEERERRMRGIIDEFGAGADGPDGSELVFEDSSSEALPSDEEAAKEVARESAGEVTELSPEEIEAIVGKNAEKLKKKRGWRNIVKKTVATAAILLIMISAMAGCGKGKDDNKNNTSTNEETSWVVDAGVTPEDFGEIQYTYFEENDPTKGVGENKYWVLKDGGLKGETPQEVIDDAQDKIERSWDYAALWGSALGVDELGGTEAKDILNKSEAYEKAGDHKFRYDVSDFIENAGWNMNDINIFAPTNGSFISEYYVGGNNVTGESKFAVSNNYDLSVRIAQRGEGSEGSYIDLTNVLTDGQKGNICKMLGLNLQEVNSRGGKFVVREKCGQIGVYYGVVATPEKAPEEKPVVTPETPVVTPTQPETPVTPVTPPASEETKTINPKSPENEKRIVEDFEESGEAEGRVEQTPSDQIGEVTPAPGTPAWERSGGSGEVPTSTGDYTDEEAREAETEQKRANANEDTTPMGDDEFEDFMRNFNLGR